MKKTQNVFAMFLLLASVLAVPMVLAEETSNDLLISEQAEEEQVPSMVRYNWEKFKLIFVRNQTSRAEGELQLARWKVAEARIATQKGNIRKAEKAVAENEKMMARVQERISNMESLTPGLDQAIKAQERRLVGLNTAFENANLSEEQRERIETNLERIGNVSRILEQNRDRIQERRQGILDDEESDDEESDDEESESKIAEQARKN
jgi:hypothetical protein